ncbi:hypothetical protein CLOP_g12933, partial [Closterium sp. NIES-67]
MSGVAPLAAASAPASASASVTASASASVTASASASASATSTSSLAVRPKPPHCSLSHRIPLFPHLIRHRCHVSNGSQIEPSAVYAPPVLSPRQRSPSRLPTVAVLYSTGHALDGSLVSDPLLLPLVPAVACSWDR